MYIKKKSATREITNVTKDEIRAEMKAKRRKISADDKNEKSHKAAAALLGTSEYQNAESVMLYFPIGNEVDTAAIAERAHAEGKRVLYPVTDEESGLIMPIEVSKETVFERGGFGIKEPKGAIYVGMIDLIIVPGVAFDREGGRLGFGKGCYDGFLAGVGAVRVGLCYGMQLTDGLPTEEHDAKMDMIVTENEIIRIKKNA